MLRTLFFTLIFPAGLLPGLAAANTLSIADAGADRTILRGEIAIMNTTGSAPIGGCQWTVNTKALDLSPLDYSNGVDVEAHIGTAGGIENITLIPFHGNQEILRTAS